MRTLVCISLWTLLILQVVINVDARVIAGNLTENAVGVYYFANTSDFSGNKLHGIETFNADLTRHAGRQCLMLDPDGFAQVRHGNKPIAISGEFSIVAWVKVPQSASNESLLGITVFAYNGIDLDITGLVGLGIENDTLSGHYIYDDGEASIDTQVKNLNNNTWQHVAFVISRQYLRLYFNGRRVAHQSNRGNEFFAGHGTFVNIWNGSSTVSAYADDVGFFKNNFSDAHIKLIYDAGLANVMSIAAVDAGGKVATTWGALKQK